MTTKTMLGALALVTALCAGARQEPLDLNGSWEFALAEGKTLENADGPDFAATDRMSVPGCWDMQPKWLCKRGTGLYRRTFTLAEPVENAWIVVDGMGLRAQFAVDGKPVGGVQPFPWAQLEIPTGPLAAGSHTLFAALDNVLEWSTQKLALPYYDFYLYGGFYHGVKMVFDNRKLFVRTRDYKTGTVEIEAVNFARGDFGATLVFDGAKEVKASFRNFRTTVRVPDFKLWSPASPNLHTVSLGGSRSRATATDATDAQERVPPVVARFGIREIKAEKKRLWLNGEILFLKGANRHEAHPQFGAATPEALMVQDIQLMKSLNGNFFRGCHYQQSQRFLDYCDEMGVLVWEEALGWGNNAKQMGDPEYFRLQVEQTRAMVRASFNHPSVIIFAFQNENASQTKEGKKMNDALIDAIRSQDSGRLVTFACNHNNDDISNANTDLISFNTYPGWIGSNAGTFENQKKLIDAAVTKIVTPATASSTPRSPSSSRRWAPPPSTATTTPPRDRARRSSSSTTTRTCSTASSPIPRWLDSRSGTLPTRAPTTATALTSGPSCSRRTWPASTMATAARRS